ncbi:MAG: hypothetical protein RDV48_25115 [Candidatus Eremiobacteraeota bacterium]|nr:hypothetical protein [Candidatus Eremiobacteraeota bacterium]
MNTKTKGSARRARTSGEMTISNDLIALVLLVAALLGLMVTSVNHILMPGSHAGNRSMKSRELKARIAAQAITDTLSSTAPARNARDLVSIKVRSTPPPPGEAALSTISLTSAKTQEISSRTTETTPPSPSSAASCETAVQACKVRPTVSEPSSSIVEAKSDLPPQAGTKDARKCSSPQAVAVKAAPESKPPPKENVQNIRRGTMRVNAYTVVNGSHRYWVSRVDVNEWGYTSKYWWNQWYTDTGDPYKELYCSGAAIGSTYVIKVTWKSSNSDKTITNSWYRKLESTDQKEIIDSLY